MHCPSLFFASLVCLVARIEQYTANVSIVGGGLNRFAKIDHRTEIGRAKRFGTFMSLKESSLIDKQKVQHRETAAFRLRNREFNITTMSWQQMGFFKNDNYPPQKEQNPVMGARSEGNLMTVVGDYLIFYVLPVITCVGIIGNVFTIIVFFNSFLKKVPCWSYLAALSISDFGFLATTMIIIASSSKFPIFSNFRSLENRGIGGNANYYRSEVEEGNLFDYSRLVSIKPELDTRPTKGLFNTNGACQIFSYLHEVFGALSVWIIVMFTVERFLVICKPWKGKSSVPTQITSISMSRANKIILILVGVTATWFSYLFITQKVVKREPKIQAFLLGNHVNSRKENLTSSVSRFFPQNSVGSNAVVHHQLIKFSCGLDPVYARISYILKNIETTVMLIVPLFVIVTCNILIARKLISYRTVWKHINLKNASIKNHPTFTKSKLFTNLNFSSTRTEKMFSRTVALCKEKNKKKNSNLSSHHNRIRVIKTYERKKKHRYQNEISGSIKPLLRQDSMLLEQNRTTVSNNVYYPNTIKFKILGRRWLISRIFSKPFCYPNPDPIEVGNVNSPGSRFTSSWERGKERKQIYEAVGVEREDEQDNKVYDLTKKMSLDETTTDCEVFSEDNYNNRYPLYHNTTSSTSFEQFPAPLNPTVSTTTTIPSKYRKRKSLKFVKLVSSFSSSCSPRNSNKSNTTNTTSTTYNSSGKETNVKTRAFQTPKTDIKNLNGHEHISIAQEKQNNYSRSYNLFNDCQSFLKDRKLASSRKRLGKFNSTGARNKAADQLSEQKNRLIHSASNPCGMGPNKTSHSGNNVTIGGCVGGGGAGSVIDSRGKNSKSQMAVTKMLLVVSTIFLLVHTPFHASRFALFIYSLGKRYGYFRSQAATFYSIVDGHRALEPLLVTLTSMIQGRNNQTSTTTSNATFSNDANSDFLAKNSAWITFPYFLRHISYAINVFLYSASGTNFRKAVYQVKRKFIFFLYRRVLGWELPASMINSYYCHGAGGISYNNTKGAGAGSLFSTYEPPSYVKSCYTTQAHQHQSASFYTTHIDPSTASHYQYFGFNRKRAHHTTTTNPDQLHHRARLPGTVEIVLKSSTRAFPLKKNKERTADTSYGNRLSLPFVHESQSEYILYKHENDEELVKNIIRVDDTSPDKNILVRNKEDSIDRSNQSIDDLHRSSSIKNARDIFFCQKFCNIQSAEEAQSISHMEKKTVNTYVNNDAAGNHLSTNNSKTNFKFRLQRFPSKRKKKPNLERFRHHTKQDKDNYIFSSVKNVTAGNHNSFVTDDPVANMGMPPPPEPAEKCKETILAAKRCSLLIKLKETSKFAANQDNLARNQYYSNYSRISLSPKYARELLTPWSADPTLVSSGTPSSHSNIYSNEPFTVKSDDHLLKNSLRAQSHSRVVL